MELRGRLRPELAIFAIIVLAALASRLYPLSISPYPFNNDSMTEYAIVKSILDTGEFPLHQDSDVITHSRSIPAFNMLLAFVSSALGVTPLGCGQLMVAVISVLTVASLFILGRSMCRDTLGGVVAAFLGIAFGTFVYTTGSVWKEALALAFMAFALMAFTERSRLGYRVLLLSLLFMLPVTHHLVAIATLLALALAVSWSWYVAIRRDALRRRHFADAATVLVPAVWAVVYYIAVSFSALELYFSDKMLLLSPGLFLFLFVVVALFLSRTKHAKMTFAPLVGAGISAFLVLDYLGYLFPYSPSAPVEFYMLLVGATAVIATVAWYGSEMIIETMSSYRTIQLCLLIVPIAIVGAALVLGLSYSSHKVAYRVFDIIDIPLFIGVGFGLTLIRGKSRRKYIALGLIVVVAATATFPFGFQSEELLGVRHDTQPYEMDAVIWLSDRNDSIRIVSDERLSYVSAALVGGSRDNDMPAHIMMNHTLPPWRMYIIQDHWVDQGVNDYPRGLVVIPEENYTRTLLAGNVYYIGGPADDRLLVLAASGIGVFYTYGPFVWPPLE